jgi:hypothetical protein
MVHCLLSFPLRYKVLDIIIDNTIIAGNFVGSDFCGWPVFKSFRGLIFVDACDHAHYTLYNRTYFVGLIFMDSRLSATTAKIGPHGNFLALYSNILRTWQGLVSVHSHHRLHSNRDGLPIHTKPIYSYMI